MTASVLSLESSFALAALLVSWVAIALLVLVVGSLHARLRRLERLDAAARPAPYASLLGRDLGALVGMAEPPRALLFVSSSCSSCARLLDEIASPSSSLSTAIAWTDGEPPADAPAGATVLHDGARLSAELGVRVTPFALVADASGRVVRAGPVASLRSLEQFAANGSAPAGRIPIFERG
jgi:hypothetical protein